MKVFSKPVILGLFIMLVSFRAAPLQRGYSLTVKVDGLRNSKGLVQFALYNREGTIPDQKFKTYYRMKTAEITNKNKKTRAMAQWTMR